LGTYYGTVPKRELLSLYPVLFLCAAWKRRRRDNIVATGYSFYAKSRSQRLSRNHNTISDYFFLSSLRERNTNRLGTLRTSTSYRNLLLLKVGQGPGRKSANGESHNIFAGFGRRVRGPFFDNPPGPERRKSPPYYNNYICPKK
jgi:hypothetical protein